MTREKLEWGTEDWIRKLRKQAEESREYRTRLYEKVGLDAKKNVLDVGCGTGAVTLDIAQGTRGRVTGLDIDAEKLKEAREVLKDADNVEIVEGDVLALPFEDESFDLVVFTIMLIYVPDQQKAVNEMARVVKKGGHVLACMEPDYAARIDYPPNPLAEMVLEGMKDLNADLTTGRKLKYLFTKAGLRTEVGIDTETDYILIKDDEKRARMIKDQVWVTNRMLQKAGWDDERIEGFNKEQIELAEAGLSFKFTPVMYAVGEKV